MSKDIKDAHNQEKKRNKKQSPDAVMKLATATL
jgi:hypothetical protein